MLEAGIGGQQRIEIILRGRAEFGALVDLRNALDQRQLRAAFEAEMTRLIDAGGGLSGVTALDGLYRLPTQTSLLATDTAAAFGTSLAQSVFRSLGGVQT